ncbi:hypothetical protein [Micrococcus sp. IITD107]|uniref:hypothetical protein n=1 Tax=Micrococcus sp. IITD107 TaxID=3342790 RepID=UPI0035B8ECBA
MELNTVEIIVLAIWAAGIVCGLIAVRRFDAAWRGPLVFAAAHGQRGAEYPGLRGR